MTATPLRLHPVYWAGFMVLVLLAIAAGLYQRRATLELSETEIINTYAARYLAANPDGALTDCRARAGSGRTRMIVICGPVPFAPDRHYEYHVAALGGLIQQFGPADWATRDPVGGRNRI